jgi:hypothetical protein
VGPAGHAERIHDTGEWVLHMRADADGEALRREIAIFTRGADGRYRRTDEVHELRLYDGERVRRLLVDGGFAVETADAYEGGGLRSPSLPGWTVFVATVASDHPTPA